MLYSGTNVAKYLEGLASYILAKDKKPKEDKIRIYRDYDLFKRETEEEAKLKQLGEINSDSNNEVPVFVQQGNYRKAVEKEVFSEDIRNIPALKDYDDFRKFLIELRSSSEERQKVINKLIKSKRASTYLEGNSQLTSIIKKNLGLVKLDMLDLKDMIVREFSAKIETKGDYTPEWDKLDMFDKEHVKELIRVKRGRDLQEDLDCIVMDLENLLENVKLTDKQSQILKLWKKDLTQEYISKILGVSKQAVNKQIDSIVKNIINEYEKQYEDWYYLNIRKGEYKRCSKCGKVKLISRFSKNGKLGYRSNCKDC